MGSIYEAVHRGTGRHVAVKVIGSGLAKDPEIVARFQREAMATGRIQSKYIAHSLDTGVDGETGWPYIVMDLLQGEDLKLTIRRLGPFPPELALRVAAQTCLGLVKAHEADVIHRDIKPANIFLSRHDGEIIVKILDFGIARVKMDGFTKTEHDLSQTGPTRIAPISGKLSIGELSVRELDPGSPSSGEAVTRADSLLGSPLYMSPEQARGKKSIDFRSDIFSLGVVLYECLCGRTPHTGAETMGELIFQITGEAARPVQELAPWVPEATAALVHRALALDPTNRFASAQEMYAALVTLLPNGHALDESQLVPLAAEALSVHAPRHTIPHAFRVPAPSAASLAATSSASLAVRPAPDSSGEFRGLPTPSGTAIPAADKTTPGSDTLSSRKASDEGLSGEPAAAAQQTKKKGKAYPIALAVAAFACLAIATFSMSRGAARQGVAVSAPSRLSDDGRGAAAATAPVAPPAPSVASSPSAPPPPPPTDTAAARSTLGAPVPVPAEPPPVVPAAAAAPAPDESSPSQSSSHGRKHDNNNNASAPPHPASTSTAPSCNPPYTLDGNGDKVWKRECF
jgi:serine/threonine-protein kinase